MRITVQGLTKRFGPLEVVSGVGFSIDEGEMFTLLGPSGCGKTTLLRLIAGFYAPDEGEVQFDGRVINDLPPHERGIGMVFQNYALWPHMTVYENVAYGLKLRKVAQTEMRERIRAVLEKVKLGGLEDRYPGQFLERASLAIQNGDRPERRPSFLQQFDEALGFAVGSDNQQRISRWHPPEHLALPLVESQVPDRGENKA